MIIKRYLYSQEPDEEEDLGEDEEESGEEKK